VEQSQDPHIHKKIVFPNRILDHIYNFPEEHGLEECGKVDFFRSFFFYLEGG